MERLHDTLEIYSIRIGELTGPQAIDILRSWEREGDGNVPLSQMTGFFDGERLLLNQDYTAYKAIKDFVLAYVNQTRERRAEVRRILHENSRPSESVARVTDAYLEYVETEKEYSLLKKQSFKAGFEPMLRCILDKNTTRGGMLFDAYAWGVIQGKREERAKRKRQEGSAQGSGRAFPA